MDIETITSLLERQAASSEQHPESALAAPWLSLLSPDSTSVDFLRSACPDRKFQTQYAYGVYYETDIQKIQVGSALLLSLFFLSTFLFIWLFRGFTKIYVFFIILINYLIKMTQISESLLFIY